MSQPKAPEDSSERYGFLQRLATFESSLVFGGVAIFLVFLIELREFLSPPILAAAAVIMLWPVRQHRTVRAILLAGAFLLLLWFVDRLRGILLPFVVVYLIAFLFDPVVTRLRDRYAVPRAVSAGAITVLTIGLLGLIIFLLVPSIINELEAMASRLLIGMADMRTWLATVPFLDRLEEAGIIDKQQITAQLTVLVQEQSMRLAESVPLVVDRILRSIGSLLGVIMIAAILPAVLFYTLKDYPFISRRLFELFPTFGGQRDYLLQAGTVVGNYMRGQLIIAAISLVNVSFFLLLFDVPFALLIGILTGILNLIPNVGAVVLNVVASLIAVIFGDPWFTTLLIVQAVILGQQLLEATFLTPKILSAHVGLHPVLIVLALFVFGYFLGVIGLLIAVPATALLMTVYKAHREQMRLDLATTHAPATVPEAPRFGPPGDEPAP
jgi:predicted PurR-regulated permease PerM